jgi:hypothetical protein
VKAETITVQRRGTTDLQTVRYEWR